MCKNYTFCTFLKNLKFYCLLLIAYCLLLRYKFLRLSNGVIMSNYKKIFSIACISVVLSGCGWMNIDPEYSSSGGGRVTAASVNQILGSDFETFNDEKMLYLLNPKIHKDDNFHKTYFPKGTKAGDIAFDKLTDIQKYRVLQGALLEVNEYDNGNFHSEKAKARRSQVQQSLISASENRCNLYKAYLRRASTYTNGIFGSFTTILAGAGSIVTGEATARLLSGLAGVSSGLRGEWNQALFESLATTMIVPGIEQRRTEIRLNIDQKKRKSLVDYTIQEALADAIQYHGACSLDAGIIKAGKSIQRYDDVGIKQFVKAKTELALANIASDLAGGQTLSGKAELERYTEKLNNLIQQINGKQPSTTRNAVSNDIDNLKTDIKVGSNNMSNAENSDKELKNILFELASSSEETRSLTLIRIKEQQLSLKNDILLPIDKRYQDLLKRFEQLP